MLHRCYLIFIVTLCLTYTVNAEFPEDPKPCKYGDSECLTKTVQYLFKEKNQGDSSINLVKLDPLQVEKIQLKQGAESPVNIDLTFLNNSIIGLSSAKVLKVSGFGKDMKQQHEIVLKIGSLQTVGDYTINGKILLLPIRGTGTNNITMVDVVLNIKFVGTPVEKNGETYMKIDKFQLDAEPGRMIIKADNLFNGDKVLGDNMNLFLNENWSDIYNELRGSIASAYGKIFKNIINQVFKNHPYNKLFTE